MLRSASSVADISAQTHPPAKKHKRPSLERTPDRALLDRLRAPCDSVRDLYGDAALHRISFSYVLDRFSHFACLSDVALGGLVEFWLSEHVEREQKDRDGIIFAALSQQRKDIFASTACAAVYDVDDLLSFAEIVERRERVGFVGPSWTTHSHGRTVSTVEERTANTARIPHDLDPCTDEQGARLLPKCRNVSVLNSGLAVDGEFYFQHDPTQRSRSVVFFAEPVPLAEVGQDGWRAIYTALGDELFGAVYDPSCKNPARIHWTPAHRPGAPHRIVHQVGRLYDWRPLWERLRPTVCASRVKARERANAVISDTPADLAEIAHCLKSIPPDIGRPEWFKVLAAVFRETKGSEQGRQLVHQWSSGAPRLYDPDDIDTNIWSWFDSDHEGGPTMGSLVWLAKEHDPKFKKFKVPPKRESLSNLLQDYLNKNEVRAS